MKIFMRKYVWHVVVVGLMVLISLIFLERAYFNIFVTHDDGILQLHAASLIILTFLLVCAAWFAAWFPLSDINKTSKGDFLLRIDERYGSNEIMQARKIIHKFYCATRPENGNISLEVHINKISEEIKKISTIEDSAKDFIHLLNFLDFLETIAYFTHKNHITYNDIDELLGWSITYYFKVFKPWIYYRRKKYNNNKYYCELELLVCKLESNAIKDKLSC